MSCLLLTDGSDTLLIYIQTISENQYLRGGLCRFWNFFWVWGEENLVNTLRQDGYK